jgi:SH3-like domain-containing protein
MPLVPPGQGVIRYAPLESIRSKRLLPKTMWNMRKLVVSGLAVVAGMAVLCAPVHAQDRKLPYWASLRYDEVRMRVGPSGEYPIEWLYKRKGLPVKVVRLREGWRLVEDPEGTQGWIASSQLDPARGVVVIGTGLAVVRADPSAAAALRWRAEPGAVARLLRCRGAWCEIDLASAEQRKKGKGLKGWVERPRLWGAEDLPGDE